MSTSIHKFEKAGLGKAPFQVVGNFESKFQAVPGDPNCPIQPGSSCDYCGQGIMDVYVVCSSDGRKFKVGCECVYKTGDAGMKKVVNSHKAKASKAREVGRISGLEMRLADDQELRALLASKPHPRDFAGQTLLDQVEWMMANSGHAGKIKTVRMVDKVIAQ